MATILIAEDKSEFREVTRLYLQRRGFSCVEASNGNEALELLKSEKIDLVLMDMNMPELDGWEASLLIPLTG